MAAARGPVQGWDDLWKRRTSDGGGDGASRDLAVLADAVRGARSRKDLVALAAGVHVYSPLVAQETKNETYCANGVVPGDVWVDAITDAVYNRGVASLAPLMVTWSRSDGDLVQRLGWLICDAHPGAIRLESDAANRYKGSVLRQIELDERADDALACLSRPEREPEYKQRAEALARVRETRTQTLRGVAETWNAAAAGIIVLARSVARALDTLVWNANSPSVDGAVRFTAPLVTDEARVAECLAVSIARERMRNVCVEVLSACGVRAARTGTGDWSLTAQPRHFAAVAHDNDTGRVILRAVAALQAATDGAKRTESPMFAFVVFMLTRLLVDAYVTRAAQHAASQLDSIGLTGNYPGSGGPPWRYNGAPTKEFRAAFAEHAMTLIGWIDGVRRAVCDADPNWANCNAVQAAATAKRASKQVRVGA